MYGVLYVLPIAESVLGFVLRWYQGEDFQFFGLFPVPLPRCDRPRASKSLSWDEVLDGRRQVELKSAGCILKSNDPVGFGLERARDQHRPKSLARWWVNQWSASLNPGEFEMAIDDLPGDFNAAF